MILRSLALFALPIQATAFPTLIDDGTPLGVAWVWYMATLVSVGQTSVRVSRYVSWLDLVKHHRRSFVRLRYWGMADEVVNPPHAGLTAIMAIWCAVGIGIYVWLVLPIIGGLETNIFFAIATIFPMSRVFDDLRDDRLEQEKLDALRPMFRKRFPRSELLSMYQCMKEAPRILWQDYTRLPDTEVNEETNRKFRERAASFVVHSSATMQRISLTFAVAAILVSVGIAIPAIFSWFLGDQSFFDWYRQAFKSG